MARVYPGSVDVQEHSTLALPTSHKDAPISRNARVQSDDRAGADSASSFLHFQRFRTDTVGEYFTLPVEVGECGSLLNIGHHRRIVHPETAIDPSTTAPVSQHREESVLVDDVLAFA